MQHHVGKLNADFVHETFLDKRKELAESFNVELFNERTQREVSTLVFEEGVDHLSDKLSTVIKKVDDVHDTVRKIPIFDFIDALIFLLKKGRQEDFSRLYVSFETFR